MKKIIYLILLLAAMTLPAAFDAASQESGNIDPAAIIQRILSVEREQLDEIKDIIFEAEFVEGEFKDNGFEEKVRFVKKIYLKFLPDTVLFHEDYLEYYKDGELQDDRDRKKEEVKRKEEKKKRKAYDISYSIYTPFYADQGEFYDIEYLGLAEEKVNDYVCHHFTVRAREEREGLIKGDYFFEAGSFNLVRVDFSPAKLVKKTMFKLSKLDMTLLNGPTPEGYWLPREFSIDGRGKSAFFFGVDFNGREYYRKPIINSGIDDKIFEVEENDE